MTVQQTSNLELTKHFLTAQFRVKDLGIGNLLNSFIQLIFYKRFDNFSL